MRAILAVAMLIAVTAWWAGADEPRKVRGVVTDDAGPVAGARVRFKGTSHTAVTDSKGHFELPGDGKRLTAWKEGYFIAGVPVGDGDSPLRLRSLPKDDNPGYAWVDPHPGMDNTHACGNCHGDIFREWAGSGHGQASTNKRFLNLYDGSDWHGKPKRGWSLLDEHPDGASVCAACHAPSVPLDDPGYDDFRKLKGVHARGVHCDYCHKIADASTERIGLEHGRFAHQLLRPKTGQLFFGSLDDVDRDEDTFSPLYQQSRYCASCHEGIVFGTKVYTTYSEWLESPARKQGKQCQSCHMTPTGKLDNIAPGRGGIKRDPATLASHAMPGATLEMLRRCLRLHVKLSREADTLRVEVETRATDVGHRVPTGFVDRHLVLIVDALDAGAKPQAAKSGPVLSSAVDQELGGRPGRFFGRLLEDEKGRAPVPFWRPNQEKADTRLKPDQPETSKWTFNAAGVERVRVRLLYRRFYKSVADDKSWPGNERSLVDEVLPLPQPGKEGEWHWPDRSP